MSSHITLDLLLRTFSTKSSQIFLLHTEPQRDTDDGDDDFGGDDDGDDDYDDAEEVMVVMMRNCWQ